MFSAGDPGGGKKNPLKSVEEDPKTDYTKYEREDVANYRQRYNFTMPEVMVQTKEEIINQYEQVEPFFQTGNKVYVDADGRLGLLIIRDQEGKSTVETLQGFRVQIYAGIERSNALETKSDFMKHYPNTPSYLKHIQPTYRVRVGDFLSKDQAATFKNKIREFFPGAFVVPDEIKIPKYKPVDVTPDDRSVPAQD